MSALDQKWHVIALSNSKRRARCATHNYRPTSYKSGAFVCASLRGLPLQPCFTLERTSDISFRGSIYGLAFAYCEFTRHRAQTILAHIAPLKQPFSRSTCAHRFPPTKIDVPVRSDSLDARRLTNAMSAEGQKGKSPSPSRDS